MGERFEENPTSWSVRYHVPRSQVWEGSRTLTATTGRRTSITRHSGAAMCNRYAWYDRDPMTAEQGPEHRCPRCVTLADRYGVDWPAGPEGAN
ncbi:hypothetical protein ACFV9C_41980 [Kribbella sp. NPDC059898]|uniref:hypothetical protein n=1 Tax=Kribbella sp. NPDC059898 TaxID=3346995 RepID=UPI00366769A8